MLLHIHLLWHLYDCLLYLPDFLINNIFSSHHYVPFCESYKRSRLATCLEIHESCFVSFTAMHGWNASLYQNTHKYLSPMKSSCKWRFRWTVGVVPVLSLAASASIQCTRNTLFKFSRPEKDISGSTPGQTESILPTGWWHFGPLKWAEDSL